MDNGDGVRAVCSRPHARNAPLWRLAFGCEFVDAGRHARRFMGGHRQLAPIPESTCKHVNMCGVLAIIRLELGNGLKFPSSVSSARHSLKPLPFSIDCLFITSKLARCRCANFACLATETDLTALTPPLPPHAPPPPPCPRDLVPVPLV